MIQRIIIFLILAHTLKDVQLFNIANIANYAKYFYIGNGSSIGNDLWRGIVRDCRKKVSFSCIQKNAYSYLDGALDADSNITVFDGFILRKNNLNFNSCMRDCHYEEMKENFIDINQESNRSDKKAEDPDYLYEDVQSPLEEVATALRDKTVKFLATRDYELHLPEYFFGGPVIQISPREIDEDGAMIRINFNQREVNNNGRIFKKIRRFIQNRLLLSFLALLLIIKLIKIKFMFLLPFLFGIGTAKKIFLKILLFFIPAFAHIFKLCSSYYNDHIKYHHHHHHKVAHHHHHVPVPVPVPAPISPPIFYDQHHHDLHSPPLEEEFQGYDYAHPHIQLRKDIDELKEWGIDTMWDTNDDSGIKLPSVQLSGHSLAYSPASQFNTINTVKSNSPMSGISVTPNIPSYAQTLAYSAYLDDKKLNRRISSQSPSGSLIQSQPLSNQINSQVLKSNSLPANPLKSNVPVYTVFPQSTNVQKQRIPQLQTSQKNNAAHEVSSNNPVAPEDSFYGPIVQRLDDIFFQLKYIKEDCKEMMICNMYKNPTLYWPHSNAVSQELSRDPHELKRKSTGSASSQRFDRYIAAARRGQNNGDCHIYSCNSNTG